MANNYIPGFTPSLYGMPVKRMALGGRMEGARTFQERDDISNFEAVGNPLGNLQNTLSNIDANSVLANYNNSVGSTAADTYQSLPTQQPVQTAAYTPDVPAYSPSDYSYDPYGIGNFDLSSYQSQPTAAQLAARDQELTKPGVSNAQWDPLSNSFMYDKAPVPTAQPTGPYYVDPGEFDPVYNPYNIGNFGLSSYQQSGPTAAQLAARDLELTKPGVAGAQWDPQANAFMYTRVPIKVTEPLTIQATSPLPPQSQPTTAAPSYNRNPAVAAVRAGLSDEMTITPRQLAAAPVANNGEVSPFTSNPYMVVNYGKDINTPSFENTQNLDPTKSYTLTNPATGQVMAQSDPSDPTSLARLVLQANQLSGNKPTDANWELAQDGKLVASDYPNRLGGVLGALVQYGLPIGLSLIPGLNWLGSAAAAGLGSTAGKLISNYDLGDALKSGLITAGTAGLLKAPILQGGQSISGAIGNAVGLGNVPNVGDLQARAIDTADFLSGLGVNPTLANQIASGSLSNIGSVGGGAVGSALGGSDAVNNLIQVIGSKGASNIPTSFLSNALGTASGALSGINYGDQVWNRPAAQEGEVREPGSSEFNPEEGIVVKAGKYDIPFDPTSILNQFLTADYTGTPDYSGYEDLINKYRDMYDIQGPPEEIPEGSDEGWEVVAPKENVVIPPPASLPDLFPPLNSVDIPTDLVKEWPEIPPADNEIVVPGYPPRAPDLFPPFFPPLNSVDIPPADTLTPPKDNPPPPDDKPPPPPPGDKPPKPDIDDILKWLPPLIGTTSSTPKSGFSAARGPLNPIFSAKLPKPNMQMAMPRALNFDAYRYGYGPEQSFFTNVPQGALNTSTAYTGYGTSPRYNATEQYASDFAALVEKMKKQREQDELEAAAAALGLTGYAEGGYAVGGPGDGREDKIPAMLSDGEYVMDAETVALLGNGSPKAGADMLDKFRVNVRKHKGRDLAKGKFSANAKKPEQYLKGRK